MSRDAFSYDPQDALDTRKTPTRASSRQSRSTPPDARDSGIPAPEAPGRGDSADARQQHSTRDERSDSRREYYVSDRAYLLRDSEMLPRRTSRSLPTPEIASGWRRTSAILRGSPC